jgi:P4 family phage/plasmid primase-like protien
MEPKSRRSKLYEFLDKHCLVSKGSEFTHTSIYDPTASYYIPPDKIDTFTRLYKDAVLHGADLYLTEKHRDIGPVVIDLDFRFPYVDNLVRKYSDEDIAAVVKLYAKSFSEFIPEDEHLQFDIYVLEKPSPILHKGLIKDGIHIVIPDIVTRPVFQLMMRERLLESIQDALSHIGLSNPIKDVVDEAVIERNNWQMLGSKKPHLDKYSVTKIYSYERMSDELQEKNVSTNPVEYCEIMSIRNKYIETKIKFEKSEDVKEYEKLIETRKMRNHFKNSVLSKTKSTRMNRVTSEEEYNRICALVDLLSEVRAENYNDWIRVGWCLRYIDHRLLDKWIEFSKKSPKFIAGECEKQWDYMRHDGACLGVGTLHLWAKEDNPQEYSRIVEEELRELVKGAKSGTEYDVARVVEKKYNHQFMYDARNRLWYHFHHHRWHLTDDGISLKKRLPTEIANVFRESASYFQGRAASPEVGQDEKDRLDEISKKLNEVIFKLKKASFQASVMTEASMLFNIEKVDEKLDSNTHLVGFENGVYDLDALEFRDGRPEDFLTMTTGINYHRHDPTNPFLPEILKFLSQVLRVEALREYVCCLFASFLHGNIREERFHVWTGTGCFAKDTPILMYDGKVKPIQDIQIDDVLMGDDSTPRNVLKLYRGHSDMYEVIPIKGKSFIVNGDHDLAAVSTNQIAISKDRNKFVVNWVEYDKEKCMKTRTKTFDTEEERNNFKDKLEGRKDIVKKDDKIIINMRQYLSLPKNVQRFIHLYRTGVEYPEKEVPLDPFLVGYWLGDGTSCHSSITTEDKPIVDYLYEKYGDNCDVHISQEEGKGNAKTYSICKKDKTSDFCFYSELRKLGIINNKRIPDIYKNNSREVRMQVLAGLMDSDGHHQKTANEFEITLKNEALMDDVISLARSLGFACYKYIKKGTWTHKGVKKTGKYFRTYIVGEGLEDIPTKLTRKVATKRSCPRNPLHVNFTVKRVEDNDFYGFELDANNLFVMGDTYTVQKNSNGKSKILELYEKAFGEYCCTLPIALLTQKRGASNSASPELARAKSKRFACLQEPGENERLNIGLMKEMTGGDKLYARGLYREGTEFKPQFKMILTCNHLPVVPSDDGGTWRRIRVVRFESRFCEHPDPNKPNEFPIDTELNTRFDDWKEPFMSLLIEYYKKIVTNKIKEPDEVMECTREYQRRNDIIMEFLDTAVEKSENGFLSVGDAFVEFKNWLKEEGVNDRTMRKTDFQNYIEKKFGKSVKKKLIKGWNGYRLRSSIADVNVQDDYD